MKLGDIYFGVSVKLKEFDNGDAWRWSYTCSSDFDKDLYSVDGTSLIDGKKHTVHEQSSDEYEIGDVNVKLSKASEVLRMSSEDEIDEDLFGKLKTLVLQGGITSNGYIDKVKELSEFLKQQSTLKKANGKMSSKKMAKKPSLFKKIATNVKRRKDNENTDIYTV